MPLKNIPGVVSAPSVIACASIAQIVKTTAPTNARRLLRVPAEANSAAEKIVAQAALSAEQETVKARNELRAEAARLAVEIATGKLTGAIQKNDHDRFVGEYLDKVVQIQ